VTAGQYSPPTGGDGTLGDVKWLNLAQCSSTTGGRTLPDVQKAAAKSWHRVHRQRIQKRPLAEILATHIEADASALLRKLGTKGKLEELTHRKVAKASLPFSAA